MTSSIRVKKTRSKLQCNDASLYGKDHQVIHFSKPFKRYFKGSGKTHTLLALLSLLCKASRSISGRFPCPVLVCAETNAAVDNLAYGLLKRKIRVVRIGPPSRTREVLQSSTLDARAERTDPGQSYLETKEKIQKLRDLVKGVEDSRIRNEFRRTIEELVEKGERQYRSACDVVLGSCEVRK